MLFGRLGRLCLGTRGVNLTLHEVADVRVILSGYVY